jgi:hypothetical protein
MLRDWRGQSSGFVISGRGSSYSAAKNRSVKQTPLRGKLRYAYPKCQLNCVPPLPDRIALMTS